MVSLKCLAVVCALALCQAALAADRPSTLRFSSRAVAGLDFTADLNAGKISGTIERHGTHRVELTSSQGGWSGSFGQSSVHATLFQARGGDRVVEINTIEGLFRYTLHWAEGNLEVSALGRSDGILAAYLSTDGSLSVDSPEMSFQVDRDAKHPTRFEGMAVIDLLDLETDPAFLDSEGALDPSTLSQTDPALFVLLYILPFHLNPRGLP